MKKMKVLSCIVVLVVLMSVMQSSLISSVSAAPIIPDPGVTVDKLSICCGGIIIVTVPVQNLKTETKNICIEIEIKDSAGNTIDSKTKSKSMGPGPYSYFTWKQSFQIKKPCEYFGTYTVEVTVKEGSTVHDSDTVTFTVRDGEPKPTPTPTEVKFSGRVTDKAPEGWTGSYWWDVKVDEWISGTTPCDIIRVGFVVLPDVPIGSYNMTLDIGDYVEVYGPVDPPCYVSLNGESYYIKYVPEAVKEVKFRGEIIADHLWISFYSFDVRIGEVLDDPTGNLQEGETVNVYGHRDGPAQVDDVTVGDEVEVFGEYRGYVGTYEQIFLSDWDESSSDHYVKKIDEKKPDLIIQDISWYPSNPEQGDTVTFTVKIKNQGAGSVGSSTVKYYTDGSYVASDSVPSLSAGSTSTQTFTWTADTCGNVQVKAVADANNAVSESNEGNNYKTKTVSVICDKPDLIVSSINFNPNPANKDDNVIVSVTVKNQGTGDAGAHYEFLGYPDHTILLMQWYCSGLKAGASKTFTHTLEDVQHSDTYEACADWGQVVQESNENNNCLTAYLEVKESEQKPDLVIQDISWSPSSPEQGDAITFTVTIKNQGSGSAGSFKVGYEVDGTFPPTAPDSVPALSLGSTSTLTFTCSFWKSGSHTIKAIADCVGEISESNEDNNEKSIVIVIENGEGTEVTCPGVADSWMMPRYPTVNNGNSGELWVLDDGVNTALGLVSFDLSAIPEDAVIYNATLELYDHKYTEFKKEVAVHRIIEPWEEMTVCYNNRPEFASSPEDRVGPDSRGWISWNITPLTQQWVAGTLPNYGLVLKASLGTNRVFASREGGKEVEQCPRLMVEYSVEYNDKNVKFRGEILTDYYWISGYDLNIRIDEVLKDSKGNLQVGGTIEVLGRYDGPARIDDVVVGDKVEVYGEYQSQVMGPVRFEQINLNSSDHYMIKIDEKKPDLVIRDVWWEPSSPKEGDEITFHVKIENIGEASAESSMARIEYSKSGDVPCHIDASVTKLEAGSTTEVQFSKTDFGFPCGDWTLRVIADANDDVDESDEGNNVVTDTMNVACGQPDLVITLLLLSTVQKTGQLTDFHVWVKNIGSGPTLDPSLNFTFGGKWYNKSIKALEAGRGEVVIYKDIGIELGIATAIVDAPDQIKGSDEKNNELSRLIIPTDVLDEKTLYRPKATKIWVDVLEAKYSGSSEETFNEKLKDAANDLFQTMEETLAGEIVTGSPILKKIMGGSSTPENVEKLLDALWKYCEDALEAWGDKQVHLAIEQTKLIDNLKEYVELVDKEKKAWENADLDAIRNCMLDEMRKCNYIRGIASEIDDTANYYVVGDELGDLRETMRNESFDYLEKEYEKLEGDSKYIPNTRSYFNGGKLAACKAMGNTWCSLLGTSATLFCPANLHAYDGQGRHVGGERTRRN